MKKRLGGEKQLGVTHVCAQQKLLSPPSAIDHLVRMRRPLFVMYFCGGRVARNAALGVTVLWSLCCSGSM